MIHLENTARNTATFFRGLGAFLRGAVDVVKTVAIGIGRLAEGAMKVGADIFSGNIFGACKDGFNALKTASTDVRKIATVAHELAPSTLRTLAHSQTPILQDDMHEFSQFAHAYAHEPAAAYQVRSVGADAIPAANGKTAQALNPTNTGALFPATTAHPLQNGTYSL
jgi:hypothetical protein